MSKPNITLEEIPEGYRVYSDKIFLLAILKTRHYTGSHRAVRKGNDTITEAVWDEVPRDQWSLHLTAPDVSVTVLEAIITVLPKAK